MKKWVLMMDLVRRKEKNYRLMEEMKERTELFLTKLFFMRFIKDCSNTFFLNCLIIRFNSISYKS